MPEAAVEAVVRAADALAGRELGGERLAHSRRTAELAAELCRRFGCSEAKARAAGLAHDLARDRPHGEIRELAMGDGLPIDDEERENVLLLHGRAAATLLMREGVTADPEIIGAVRDHVAGRPGMGALAQALLCADYLEPGRPFLDREERARILARDLAGMTRAVIERKLAWVAKPARATRQLYEELARHA